MQACDIATDCWTTIAAGKGRAAKSNLCCSLSLNVLPCINAYLEVEVHQQSCIISTNHIPEGLSGNDQMLITGM